MFLTAEQPDVEAGADGAEEPARRGLPGALTTLTLRIQQGQYHCPHCDQPTLLAAHLPPTGWRRADLTRPTVLLCITCDTGHGADGIRAFLALYGTLTANHPNEFSELVGQWLDEQQSPGQQDQHTDNELNGWQ